MDDYAEIDDTKPEGGSRAMSWMVLAVAVGGFAALAYYAYNSGSNAVGGEATLVVEADQAPIKQAPLDPDGEEFPNKDKTIYDVISPSGEAKTAEKLLPEPEHPVAAANVEDSEDLAPATASASVPQPAQNTTTFVAAAPQPQAKDAAVAATAAALAAATPTQPVAQPPVAVVVKPVVAAAPTPAEKSFASPEMVNEKTLTGKKDEAKPAEVKEKPKAVAKPKAEKPAVKEVAGGAYKVQLGAYKSESEANAAWKKISGAHSAVLSGAPTIVKADVNGSTFYRLRAGSYASADAAKAVCAKLGGQACFPAK
ncbi:MAG: SPOR domain-containing protein [Rickettsiales bacterium]|nr:SPOR domain-containing protein [Rickettsiales bacterium]